MQRYIGLDVHATSTTLAIIGPSGKRLGSEVIATSAAALIDRLKAVQGERYVCMEEGTQSGWLYELLSPHAAEVVVVMRSARPRGPKQNKNDEHDAYELAEMLRTGQAQPRVFKEQGGFKRLRELARVYTMVMRDVVRVQNRIKALYRSRGVGTSGKSIYRADHREAWIEKLPDVARAAASTLHTQYDVVEAVRRQAEKDLVQEVHHHPVARLLETCPGLGPIRVAQLLPIVVSPWRFRTKRQFWSYCGLGIVMRSSSDWVQRPDGGWTRSQVQQTRGLNRRHNTTLKCLFKGAATTVVTQLREEPLHQDYQRIVDAGTKPNLAKLTLARKIAAIALAMWKHQEEYAPSTHRSKD
jgi:transposase